MAVQIHRPCKKRPAILLLDAVRIHSLPGALGGLLQLGPLQQRGQRAHRTANQRVVIGQVDIVVHIIRWLQKGFIQRNNRVPFGFQSVQNALKPRLYKALLCKGKVACFLHIAIQGDHRRAELIQLEAWLQHGAVDIAAVHAEIARLPGKYIGKDFTRIGRVHRQNGREGPQQAVPVPISGGDIIPRAAAGHQAQLFRIDGAPGGIEKSKEQVGIQDFAESGISQPFFPRGQPTGGALVHCVKALTKQLLGAGRGGHAVIAHAPGNVQHSFFARL